MDAPTSPKLHQCVFDQGRNRKRKCDRETDIAEVEQRRVNGETDVLQDWIQITPLEWGLRQTHERVRSEKNE
jgi:hypothetical protein